jgi:hypothetical protein
MSLSIKLMIILKSKLFQNPNIRKRHYPTLLSLVSLSVSNYDSDCAFLELYKTTINSKEEHSLYECIIPFDIILTIILEQITTNHMEEHYARFMHEIVRASLTISTDIDRGFRKYSASDLAEVVK